MGFGVEPDRGAREAGVAEGAKGHLRGRRSGAARGLPGQAAALSEKRGLVGAKVFPIVEEPGSGERPDVPGRSEEARVSGHPSPTVGVSVVDFSPDDSRAEPGIGKAESRSHLPLGFVALFRGGRRAGIRREESGARSGPLRDEIGKRPVDRPAEMRLQDVAEEQEVEVAIDDLGAGNRRRLDFRERSGVLPGALASRVERVPGRQARRVGQKAPKRDSVIAGLLPGRKERPRRAVEVEAAVRGDPGERPAAQWLGQAGEVPERLLGDGHALRLDGRPPRMGPFADAFGIAGEGAGAGKGAPGDLLFDPGRQRGHWGGAWISARRGTIRFALAATLGATASGALTAERSFSSAVTCSSSFRRVSWSLAPREASLTEAIVRA